MSENNRYVLLTAAKPPKTTRINCIVHYFTNQVIYDCLGHIEYELLYVDNIMYSYNKTN